MGGGGTRGGGCEWRQTTLQAAPKKQERKQVNKFVLVMANLQDKYQRLKERQTEKERGEERKKE